MPLKKSMDSLKVCVCAHTCTSSRVYLLKQSAMDQETQMTLAGQIGDVGVKALEFHRLWKRQERLWNLFSERPSENESSKGYIYQIIILEWSNREDCKTRVINASLG